MIRMGFIKRIICYTLILQKEKGIENGLQSLL